MNPQRNQFAINEVILGADMEKSLLLSHRALSVEQGKDQRLSSAQVRSAEPDSSQGRAVGAAMGYRAGAFAVAQSQRFQRR